MNKSQISVVLALTIASVTSANAQCYQFSSGSIQLRINIGVINLVVGPSTDPMSGFRTGTTVFSSSNTFIIGGTTQTSTAIQDGTANIQYFPALGSDPAFTTFQISVPDATTGTPGPGSHSWTASLFGVGDLLPATALPQVLPPASLWVLPNNGNYIQVASGASRIKYPIDRVSTCGTPTSGLSGKGLGSSSDVPGGCDCGDPISIGNGNLFEEIKDYQTVGLNRLMFTRYYNSFASPNTVATALGLNWRTNYDRYLRLNSSSSVTAERADGQEVEFTLVGSVWTSDTDVDLNLTNFGSTWTLTDRSDSVETYTANSTGRGLLQSIVARGGYTQTVQYDTSNQLASVTDSYGRRLAFVFLAGKLLTVTAPDGLVISFTYSGNQLTVAAYNTTPGTHQTYLYENVAFPNALTGMVDENGIRFTTWAYDTSGRAISSQHADGADLTTVSYNDGDGSRTITNALGLRTVYKFTTFQNVPKLTEIDRLATSTTPSAVTTLTYDSRGYQNSQTNWNGIRTTTLNDPHGQPLSITQADGTPQARTITTTYHPTFHLPVQIVEPGLTVDLTYDSNGNLLTVTRTDTTTNSSPYSTNGAARTWSYTWSNFLMVSVKGPRTDANDLTTFTYDATGSLTSITNALNRVISIGAHLPGGLPQTMTDPNGITTNYAYDRRLRLTSATVNTAAGPLTSKFTYDLAGNLVTVTSPDNSSLAFTFDNARRLTAVTDALQNRTSYVLDALGDRTTIASSNPGGITTHRRVDSFDALGRLAQKIEGAGQVTTYLYDSNGNLIGTTDPLQHATQRTVDPLDRFTKTTDAAGGIVSATFNARNRVLNVTDPNSSITSYVYDGFGDVIQESSPARGTIVYRYDAAGNLMQRTDARGAVAKFIYDALNRVLTTTYPANPAENVSYTYDEAGHGFGIGRLTGVTDAAGKLSRSYDERGNVVSESRVRGGITLGTAFTYDAANRISSITYPSKAAVTYTRDAAGKVTSVLVKPAGASQAVSVASDVTYQPFGLSNGLTLGNGISETRTFDLSNRINTITAASSLNLHYVFDAANNVLSITNGVTPGNDQTFSYDSLNRLTQASGIYGSRGYTYDSNGNRLTETGTGDLRTLDGLSITSLSFNEAGHLASTSSGSQQLTQYTYSAFGQRLVKQGATTGSTLYQYNLDGTLLEEADGQGTMQADYVYLNGRPIATLLAGGTIYFLHDDRLGAPQRVTDKSQKTVWSADYEPFGALNAATSQTSTALQNLRLPGQELDMETGLHHNGFRDYAPGLGRYLQSDPVGIVGGTNTYAYGSGNPLRFADPLGLCDLPDLIKWVDEQLNDKAEEKAKEAAGYEAFLKTAAGVEDGSATAEAIALRNSLTAEYSPAFTALEFGYIATKPVWAELLSDPDLFPHYGTPEFENAQNNIETWRQMYNNPVARAQIYHDFGWPSWAPDPSMQPQAPGTGQPQADPQSGPPPPPCTTFDCLNNLFQNPTQ